MSKIWLHIVGMGEGEFNSQKLELINSAKNIIGAPRLLKRVPTKEGQNIIKWNKPFKKMSQEILSLRGEQTIILASGDPNYFGIGATLNSILSEDEFISYPAVSSFQLAASKMHWALQNVDCISLHGRMVENLHKYLFPKNRILALTSDKNTLVEVASLLKQRGYEKSNLSVLENLGAEKERIISFVVNEVKSQKIDDFYVLAIDCIKDNDIKILPNIAGLPDESFICDGQLTKREVRAISLAKLAPFPNAILWDIGAGSGSIAIEFMRSARGAKAICFERDEKRISMIKTNAKNLGVPDLKIVNGDAVENLANQPKPDVIFIGGNVANETLFEGCFKALKNGGRLVVNAVSIEGEKALYERYKKLGGELIKIDINRAKKIGVYNVFEPKKTVTQWALTKGEK